MRQTLPTAPQRPEIVDKIINQQVPPTTEYGAYALEKLLEEKQKIQTLLTERNSLQRRLQEIGDLLTQSHGALTSHLKDIEYWETKASKEKERPLPTLKEVAAEEPIHETPPEEPVDEKEDEHVEMAEG